MYKKILIVDDELNIRKTLSDILRFRGYEVISADNGKTAIEMAEKEKPYVVLLDMKLDDISGLDLLKIIKETFPFMECIILTGYASQSSAIQAVNLGAYGYIQKPCDIEQLITMIKRAIEKINTGDALRESEQRYKTLFDNAGDAIFILEPGGKFLDVNKVAYKRLGYEKEELLNMTPEDIDTPEYAIMVEDRISEIISKKQLSFETAHRCKNGKIIYVELNNRLIDYRGKTAILSTARDITERKEAEKEKEKLYAQLLQIQKMEALGLLAGGIAHDFNNILSGIIGYSELALYDIKPDNPVRIYIEKVIKASNRAKELAKQILTFGRREFEGKKDIKPSAIVREALTFMRSTLPTTIEIKDNISSKNSIKADPSQIYQILLNLCTNAGHAMRDNGGILEVSLTDTEIFPKDIAPYSALKAGKYIKLSVKDTGHGMEPEVLERIFEPFFTTKKRGEGTGMGLSVVHGIIKNHEGDISVSSEPGKGTIFNILLPVSEQTATGKEEVSSCPVKGKGNILIVDDEKDIVEITENMLIKLGYSVTATTSSMKALQIFKSRPSDFDLIITDLTMPEITGVNLAREIFKINQTTPVIVCTGLMDAMPSCKEDKCCIKEVIDKPVSIKKLSETIKNVLETLR